MAYTVPYSNTVSMHWWGMLASRLFNSGVIQQSTIKSAIAMPISVLKAYQYPMGYAIRGIPITTGILLPQYPNLEKLARIQGLDFSTAIHCVFVYPDAKDNDG